MSQYIEFFVKSKEGNFTCIAMYSRNTFLYHISNKFAPYGKVKKLTQEQINILLSDAQYELKVMKEQKAIVDNQYNAVCSFNNTVSEKLEALEHIQQELNEYTENIDEINQTIHVLQFMAEIIDTLSYESGNPCMYFGIEVGEPTEEDIVE